MEALRWGREMLCRSIPSPMLLQLQESAMALQGLWDRRCTLATQKPMRQALCGQKGWFHVAGCHGRAQGCRRGQQYHLLVGTVVAVFTTRGWFLEGERWVQPCWDILCPGAAAKMHLPSADSTHSRRLMPQRGPLKPQSTVPRWKETQMMSTV